MAFSEPTNEDRANWARAALEVFSQKTGLDMAVELDCSIGDLLANMMHLCKQEGLDFDALLETGRMHFEAETDEEEAMDSHKP